MNSTDVFPVPRRGLDLALALAVLWLAPAALHASPRAPSLQGLVRYGGKTATVKVNYAMAAGAFRKRYGLMGTQPEQVDFEELLATRYVRVRLGLLDLRHPLYALADKESAALFQAVCLQALLTQQHWLETAKQCGAETKDLERDFKAARSWVKGWSVSKLRKLDRGEERDLTLALKTKPKTLDAVNRLAAGMGRAPGLGLDRVEPHVVRVLIAPTREDFIELVSFAGWRWPDWQGAFWHETLANWTECLIEDTRVMALEFTGTPDKDDEKPYAAAFAMKDWGRTGLEQHITQRVSYALFDDYFGAGVDPVFASALSVNQVIDLFGEENTRTEGDLEGSSEPPTEMFVPGGNSAGGVLPSPNLLSRFRENKGADHFLRALFQAQKQGARDARNSQDKLVAFLLVGRNDVTRYSIRAPFLGTPGAEALSVPDDFEPDYLEFFRAYKTAFVFWLRTEAGKSKADCERRWASLLKALAVDGQLGEEERENFELIVPRFYEAETLSDAELSKQSLEGQFLRWLKKQS